MFTGLKNSATMFASALLAYGVLGPTLVCRGTNVPFTTASILSGCAHGGLMGGKPEVMSACSCVCVSL